MNDGVQTVEVHLHLAVAVVANVPAALAGGTTGKEMTAGDEAELHLREVRVGGAFLQWTTGRGTTLGIGLGHLPWMTA